MGVGGSGNTIDRVTSLNRQTGIQVVGDLNLVRNNSFAGAVTGISGIGQGNQFFGNDLSFASVFCISITQDKQFQIAGNDFSHSANGLNLYDIDGLVASPNPGSGQISMDVSTIPGEVLLMESIRNSQFSGLDLSWGGAGL